MVECIGVLAAFTSYFIELRFMENGFDLMPAVFICGDISSILLFVNFLTSTIFEFNVKIIQRPATKKSKEQEHLLDRN